MAVVLKLKCPDCAETFKWPGAQEWPRYCPMCQAPQTTRADDEICLPAIRTYRMKTVDNVYNDMSAASEVRAQQAADMLGVSVSDVSDLKITNLRDDKDPNRGAHVSVVNEVSKMMDAAPDATGFQAMGAQFSGAVQTGPFANSGAKTQTMIRSLHAKTYGHNLVGDNPSNEVMNPNYRRRA